MWFIPITSLLYSLFKFLVKLLKILYLPKADFVAVSWIIILPLCSTMDIEILLACS